MPCVHQTVTTAPRYRHDRSHPSTNIMDTEVFEVHLPKIETMGYVCAFGKEYLQLCSSTTQQLKYGHEPQDYSTSVCMYLK